MGKATRTVTRNVNKLAGTSTGAKKATPPKVKITQKDSTPSPKAKKAAKESSNEKKKSPFSSPVKFITRELARQMLLAGKLSPRDMAKSPFSDEHVCPAKFAKGNKAFATDKAYIAVDFNDESSDEEGQDAIDATRETSEEREIRFEHVNNEVDKFIEAEVAAPEVPFNAGIIVKVERKGIKEPVVETNKVKEGATMPEVVPNYNVQPPREPEIAWHWTELSASEIAETNYFTNLDAYHTQIRSNFVTDRGGNLRTMDNKEGLVWVVGFIRSVYLGASRFGKGVICLTVCQDERDAMVTEFAAAFRLDDNSVLIDDSASFKCSVDLPDGRAFTALARHSGGGPLLAKDLKPMQLVALRVSPARWWAGGVAKLRFTLDKLVLL